MDKWYETDVNERMILSSRIRLARNFKSYRFPQLASDSERQNVINDAASALSKHEDKNWLEMIKIDTLDDESKRSLIERHMISPLLMAEKKPSCAFVSKAENISIMVMEEDHIRVQAIEAGDNIDAAYSLASEIDDLIDSQIDYAFDEKLGYLTSCPTNAGTGVRASFMVHIPYLETSGQISNISRSIGKFGYTIRGTYGEGTDAYGAVYQISNQITLGITEQEILGTLKSLTQEIVQSECSLMKADLRENRLLAEDNVYRTYGILTNARQISEKEAIKCLSVLKLGCASGIIKMNLPNIYSLIINSRMATLIKKFGVTDYSTIPQVRARYLRESLSGVNSNGGE